MPRVETGYRGLIKKYYWLTKPGIIYGNLVTAAAGFFLASKTSIDFWLLVAVLVGTSLVIASGCVYNNYIDREIDAAMTRTRNRALVKGSVERSHALFFATILGIVGFLVLGLYTNDLTLLVGAIGFVDYVVVYSFAKRRTPYGTIVGSIAGATPPVAGYVAVTNHFDGGALLLFIILALWQMPHFYSIAMFRLKDYRAAGLPVLPLKKDPKTTKIRILLYILAFILASALLTLRGYTGYIYLISAVVLGVIWFVIGLKGFNIKNDVLWARRMFFFSLVILAALCFLISFGRDVNSWF